MICFQAAIEVGETRLASRTSKQKLPPFLAREPGLDRLASPRVLIEFLALACGRRLLGLDAGVEQDSGVPSNFLMRHDCCPSPLLAQSAMKSADPSLMKAVTVMLGLVYVGADG